MNFQQLKHHDPMVESALIDFCIRSKPYDFCSIKSHSLKLTQIKKYYEFLLNKYDIFYHAQNGDVRFFIAISHEKLHTEIRFIFGATFNIEKDFRAFREFYWKQFNCSKPFVGEVKRHHKLKTYLKGIEKRDANAKISLDNGEILVSYTRDGI
jgi:ADP-heptose:LPS heptosyltransferase